MDKSYNGKGKPIKQRIAELEAIPERKEALERGRERLRKTMEESENWVVSKEDAVDAVKFLDDCAGMVGIIPTWPHNTLMRYIHQKETIENE